MASRPAEPASGVNRVRTAGLANALGSGFSLTPV